MNSNIRVISALFAASIATLLVNIPLLHAQGQPLHTESARVVSHWTSERRSAATPRDLVIDGRGLGYLRKSDGSLEPYGHSQRALQLRGERQTPFAKPPGAGGGGSDTTLPEITEMVPAAGAVIGAIQFFSATITDASGIKSVSFVVTYPNGTTTQTFSPGYAGNDSWLIELRGFTDGPWSWHVVAKDGAGKGGNTRISDPVSFTVETGGSGGGSGGGGNDDTTTNAAWSAGGAVQKAAGRIYFEMPNNAKRKGPWSGYVCSGTVSSDDTAERSIVITAAHCVYDDSNKAFARNVLFIPNQDGTIGTRTDTNCDNDPFGCWVPSFGVVDSNWTQHIFPNNIEWDYAYYVVSDSGAHADGFHKVSDILDDAVGSLPINFLTAHVDDDDPTTSSDFTHALGYSYSDDPNFMYCAEDMTTEGDVNWWLANCGLSGGSSGGPWVQPMDSGTGSGPIISVNSWGYTTAPGMAGPQFVDSSAACIFGEAKGLKFAEVPATDGSAGVASDNCP